MITTKTSVLLFSFLTACIGTLCVPYSNLIYAGYTSAPFNSTDQTNSKPDWFDIKGELKKNKGGFFDSGNDNYNVKKFAIVLSNSSYLCPTNNCEFTFKHAETGQGFEIKDAYERQFEGTLKVKKDGKSKIYEIFGLYQVTGINNDKQQVTGNTYISLGEDLNLGDGINDKEYKTNGTLIWKNNRNNADLLLHGDRIRN
jgi:hypothetical protein